MIVLSSLLHCIPEMDVKLESQLVEVHDSNIINVDIIDDDAVEITENFIAAISLPANSSGVVIGQGTIVVSILDDDCKMCHVFYHTLFVFIFL